MSNLPNIQKFIREFANHPKILSLVDGLTSASANLYKPTDFLRRLNLILKSSEYRTAFLDTIRVEKLVEWMQNPPTSNDIFYVLQEMRLLPTPEILAFVESEPSKEGLEKVIHEIREGNFDATDNLKLELEYSRFKFNGLKQNNHIRQNIESLEQFRELPWIENDLVFLGRDEIIACDTLALEAMGVLNLIKKSRSEVPILVIANRRYGSDYVVTPIEDILNEMRVDVVHEYITSYAYTDKKIGDYYDNRISERTWKLIAEKNPHIFIVDGTIEHEKNGRTRFPGAMWGYINAFNTYNKICENVGHEIKDCNGDIIKNLKPSVKYKIKFWSPDMTETIYVGGFVYDMDQLDGPRELTLVSSISNEGTTSHAYFDDVENYIKLNHIIGFTSHGVDYRLIAKDEKSFVESLQREMKTKIAELLRG